MKKCTLNFGRLLFFMLVVLIAGCKEKYDSPVPSVDTGYLVVEGVINNGGDTTNIRLSRTTNLGETFPLIETGALVSLEGSDATSYFFTEVYPANYNIYNLHLDTAVKYRLSIKTSNNEQYQSDFVSVRNNPPIDSVSWERQENGVQLYINTHDPDNNTLYYQWEYNETWEFHTRRANLKYVGNPLRVEFRDANDPQITTCWQYDASTSILLGSTAKLSEDIVHLPLTLIPSASIKLSVLYSINVKQYSWTKEGYEFLERMKKNTESLGSIFDAQPSQLNSNIHCTTNPGQPVIGFVSICTIRENRIFINNNDLLNWGYSDRCQVITLPNIPDSIAQNGQGTLPIEPVLQVFFSIVTFSAADAPCVDCRLSGSNVKPYYWP